VEKWDRWLNTPGATEADLKARTFTNLYRARGLAANRDYRRRAGMTVTTEE